MTDDETGPLAEVLQLTNASLVVVDDEQEPKQRRCDHLAIGIDRLSRRVRCRDCLADLDPFVWICFLADHWKRYLNRRRILLAEIDILSERKKQLAVEERRLRDRVSRLRRKDQSEGKP